MLKKLLFKKDCGAKEVLVEIGLVVVAIFLLVIFRNEIKSILTTIITSVNTNITGLFK